MDSAPHLRNPSTVRNHEECASHEVSLKNMSAMKSEFEPFKTARLMYRSAEGNFAPVSNATVFSDARFTSVEYSPLSNLAMGEVLRRTDPTNAGYERKAFMFDSFTPAMIP